MVLPQDLRQIHSCGLFLGSSDKYVVRNQTFIGFSVSCGGSELPESYVPAQRTQEATRLISARQFVSIQGGTDAGA